MVSNLVFWRNRRTEKEIKPSLEPIIYGKPILPQPPKCVADLDTNFTFLKGDFRLRINAT